MASKYQGRVETSDEEDAASDADEAVATLLNSESEPLLPLASTPTKKRKNSPEEDNANHIGPKRKESHVWRFYDKRLDRTKSCKICSKVFSSNTATGALRKHLTSHLGEQTDAILTSAQTALEVTISPSTNTVTVSGMESSNFTDTIIATTPLQRKRRPVGPRGAVPVTGDNGKKSRFKSTVWTHFVKHADGRPECLHCHYVYSSNASTSGLRRHAEQHERERLAEGTGRNFRQRPVQDSAKPSGSVSIPPAGNRPMRPLPLASAPLFSEENFMKLIIKQHIPLTDIPDHFLALNRVATGRAPTAEQVGLKLKALFGRKKEEIKGYLKQTVGKISLSLEGWTSSAAHSYLIVTAHVMTDTWTPVRFLLCCTLLSPDVLADDIRDYMAAVLQEFDCADRILAVATAGDYGDDAVNTYVNQAFQLYTAYIRHSKGMDIAQVHCIGSGLKHCVEPALAYADRPLNKIRRFLKILLNTGKFSDLKNHSHLCLEEYHELKLDSPSIWTSTVVMMDAACKMKIVIDDIIKQNPELFDPFIEDDWMVLACVFDIVSNFYLAAQDIGKTEYPPLSSALPLMEYLTASLTTQRDRPDYPPWAKKLARDMLERTNTVLQAFLTDVYFFGTILDPRHKLATLPESLNRNRVEDSLRSAFSRYILSSPSGHTPESTATTQNGITSTYKAGSLMSAILKKTQAAAVQPQLDELNQYLNTAVEGPDTDPLTWWENYRKVYPHLALMARDYMGISATSVPSEELFIKEKVAGKLRNRLEPEDILTYTCLKSWVDFDFRASVPSQSSLAVPNAAGTVKIEMSK